MNSFGRKKRDAKDDDIRSGRNIEENINLREMFRVYEKRNDIIEPKKDDDDDASGDKLIKAACLTETEYYGLIVTIIVARLRSQFSPNLKRFFSAFDCHCGSGHRYGSSVLQKSQEVFGQISERFKRIQLFNASKAKLEQWREETQSSTQ